jgi:hypothetical protein
VGELDQEKLSDLLQLKYHTVTDGEEHAGVVSLLTNLMRLAHHGRGTRLFADHRRLFIEQRDFSTDLTPQMVFAYLVKKGPPTHGYAETRGDAMAAFPPPILPTTTPSHFALRKAGTRIGTRLPGTGRYHKGRQLEVSDASH